MSATSGTDITERIRNATCAPLEPAKTPRFAWVILLVVFLASVIAPLNLFKVPPSIPQLVSQFHLSMTSVGLLMSVFSIAGLVLAFPAGFFLGKLGAKTSGALAVLLMAAGSVWGTYSSSSTMLLLSRTLEGAGMAIMAVVAPVMISAWFPAKTRGLALGIWTTWFSVGIVLMMNIAPPLLAGGSWRRVWWFGTIASLGALVLFLILYRDPPTGVGLAAARTEGARHSRTSQNLLLAALSIRDVWLLSISFVVFNILTMSTGTFLPAFLMKQHHLGAPTAGLYSSLGNMVMLISCPLGGFMSDRLKVKKWIIAVGFTLLTIFWLFAFSLPLHFVPAVVILFGIVGGPILPACLALLPDIVRHPELMGFGMAILMFTMTLGSFIGPVLFGRILDISSWTVASYAMIPVCLIGAVTASMIRCR